MSKRKGYRLFERPRKTTADVAFDEDHEFYGAEATVALDGPMDFYFTLAGDEFFKADPIRKRELIKQFGDTVLVEWNLEDRDGNPVPATGAGLLTQPISFGTDLIIAWIQAGSPPAPLSEPSSDGNTPESGATTTATKPASRASSRRSK